MWGVEGPERVALKGSCRDSGGGVVHFSGAGWLGHAARWVEKVGPWLASRLGTRGFEEASAEIGAPYIELHTGAYAEQTRSERELELGRLIAAAKRAHEIGLKVNAGHGLSLDNIGPILNIPHLDTLNIGHSIVCHAVFAGLERAVREMLAAMAAKG